MSTPANAIQSQTLAKLVRSKYPGAYDDMDDATLEKNVLAKYPQYSDLPRTPTGQQFQPPDAVAQAHAQMKAAIPIEQQLGAYQSPQKPIGFGETIQPVSAFTEAGRQSAENSKRLSEYNRQSGQMIGQTAAGMATGGLLPAVKGAGLASNFLRFLGRAGISGASMGAGTVAGGGTPQEAKGAAITGAAGQPIAEGASAFLSKIAPSMAESALKVTERMRGRGRTIGQSVLDETSGVAPATLAKQAGARTAALTNQMEAGVHQATAQGAVGTTQPAHDVLNDAIQNLPRNARTIRDKFNSLHDLLDLEGVQGPVRGQYSPDELLEMKRGIGKEMGTWPPEWQKLPDVKNVQQRLYGAIDGELDRLVPGNAELNQKISSLIPAKQQAARLSNQATAGQRIAGRVAAHTGALAGSGIGGYLGYREGGPKGAAIGAAAGLTLPELLASPTAQMTAARMTQGAGNQVVSPGVLPFLKAIAASREPNKKQDNAEKQ